MFITTEKLHILANERYRGRKGSTALTASSAIRATNEEKGISNTNHPYRRENTVAEGKESAITSISDSPRSTRGATFKRNNDHQEYVPDEFLNLDYNGDRGSGKGHRQSIESSSSRPRISSSSSIYDRNDQLAFELPKSRPKSSTTPLRIDTVKSADSAQFDDAPHGLLVRSAGSDYDDDTETLNMSYGSSKCRRSRSTDYRAKDTKQIVENSSSHPRNHPPSGSAASTFFNSDCDSPTDIIEDVGEPQEYCPRPLPRKKESDMSRYN